MWDIKLGHIVYSFRKKLIFEKLSNKAYDPKYGTLFSSGIDFFSPKEVLIKKGKDALIPLDIRVRLPNGYDLTFFNKSGVAVNKKLIVGACLIDNDYRGNIHAHLFNLGDKDILITPGDKIVQGVVRKVEFCKLIEQNIIDKTERGTGGFGSTGSKN